MDLVLKGLGWTGTLLIVAAYLLLSFKKLDSTDKVYLWMNLTGSIAIACDVVYHHVWPVVFLQIVWGGAAISGLLLKKRQF